MKRGALGACRPARPTCPLQERLSSPEPILDNQAPPPRCHAQAIWWVLTPCSELGFSRADLDALHLVDGDRVGRLVVELGRIRRHAAMNDNRKLHPSGATSRAELDVFPVTSTRREAAGRRVAWVVFRFVCKTA